MTTDEPGTPRPPAALETKAELQAGALGDVTWRPVRKGGRTITIINRRTGVSWVRDAPGGWRLERRPRPAPVAREVGALLLSEQDGRVDAIAALLRQQFRPWRELLDAGAEAALEADGGGSWARVGKGKRKVAELLKVTELRPHRIVLVVDDVEALAASWHADAGVAVDPAWATYCRHQARQAGAAGAGEYPVGTYDDRAAALVELVKLRGGQRPGQSWRVEPVKGHAPGHG